MYYMIASIIFLKSILYSISFAQTIPKVKTEYIVIDSFLNGYDKRF